MNQRRNWWQCFCLLTACLIWLPVAAGAAGAEPQPPASGAPENAYQLKIVTGSDATEPSLELLHFGEPIARKAIPQAPAESRLAAAMTPDGERVAFIVRESTAMATLWLGMLRQPSAEDVVVERVDTEVDELAAYWWDLGGTRLAYSIHRGAGRDAGEEVMTEIWLWAEDPQPETWMVFSGHGRLELMGWRADGRLLLRGPDGTVATFDLDTAEYQVDASADGHRPALTQITPRIPMVLKGANNADVIPGGSSVPSSMTTNETRSVSIQVYNNGSSTWTYSALHRLGAEWAGYNNQVTWSGWNCGGYMNSVTDGRAFLCNSVYPGYYYTFYFNITAPGSTGTYRLAVRMVQDAVEWFGESYYWNISVSGGGCPNTPVATRNDRWKLEIWNNRWFSGGTVEQRYDFYGSGGFAYNWGTGRPSNCTGNDNYAVRFSRSAYYPNSTTYTFTTRTDDGVRLWVDGVLIIDHWIDQAPTTYTANRYLTAGYHDLRMDYYENGGGAVAELSWAAAGGVCPGGQYDIADYALGDSPYMRVFSRMQHNGAEEEFGYRDGGYVGSLKREFFIKNTWGDNWEEFGYTSAYLYRYRDTSWGIKCDNNPSADAYYGLIDNDRSSYAKWAPRCMYVGQIWHSNVGSRVDAGYKNWNGQCDFGCTSIYEGGVWQRTKLLAHHSNYTTIWGVNVPDVIELTPVDGNGNPTGDHFWYAKAYGLVGFEGPNPGDPPNPYRSGAFQIDDSGHGVPPRVTLCGD